MQEVWLYHLILLPFLYSLILILLFFCCLWNSYQTVYPPVLHRESPIETNQCYLRLNSSDFILAFLTVLFNCPFIIQELPTDRQHFRADLICLNPYSSLCLKKIQQTSRALGTTSCYSPKPCSQLSKLAYFNIVEVLLNQISVFWINDHFACLPHYYLAHTYR